MIAMQYKIVLPDDFDMNVIRERVITNGSKTDGFRDLLFKAYLISENSGSKKGENKYSPLYLWNDNGGMNEFIFNGFYDNILKSFGWQKINIGVPFKYNLEENFIQSKYVLEIEREILPSTKMHLLNFSLKENDCTGKLLIYNPDKWKYVEYYFYGKVPIRKNDGKVSEILHLSM